MFRKSIASRQATSFDNTEIDQALNELDVLIEGAKGHVDGAKIFLRSLKRSMG